MKTDAEIDALTDLEFNRSQARRSLVGFVCNAIGFLCGVLLIFWSDDSFIELVALAFILINYTFAVIHRRDFLNRVESDA